MPDREALADVIRELRDDFIRRGDDCENFTPAGFLDAPAGWMDGECGWYANHGQELPAQGDWTFVARALNAAVVYE